MRLKKAKRLQRSLEQKYYANYKSFFFQKFFSQIDITMFIINQKKNMLILQLSIMRIYF